MDLLIDENTNDLVMATGDPATVTDIREIAQQVKHRLLTFRGEWFLDLSVGPNYTVDVFKKNPSMDLVRSILVAEAQTAIDGRADLSDFQLALVNATRLLEVSFTVRLPQATEEVQTAVTIG